MNNIIRCLYYQNLMWKRDIKYLIDNTVGWRGYFYSRHKYIDSQDVYNTIKVYINE